MIKKIYLFILLLTFSIVSYISTAQKKENDLDRLDTTAFAGRAFLNKANFLKSLYAQFRNVEKDNKGTNIYNLNPRQFDILVTNLINASLVERQIPESFKKIQSRTKDEKTANNIIPIGILNSEAVILTSEQILENERAKSNKQKIDGKKYENITLTTACLMQSEVYQGNIQFQVDMDLIISDNFKKIKGLEIDFQDGKGWRFFEAKNQLIDYRFDRIGHVSVGIKVITNKGDFITYSNLEIKQLERPKLFKNNEIKINIAQSNRGARLSNNVVGANYAIFNGCDGVFDKPIIIAEGFDIGEDVNIDELVAKYYKYLYIFVLNGYDLVFVNYHDGRDYLDHNAWALQKVIEEVNTIKVGNQKLIVIGESMSGLIARWALRSMENEGKTHNVSHFIAFDTPNLGANVPPGLVQLAQELPYLVGFDISRVIEMLVPETRALNTGAACQLLKYISGNGSSHQLFYSFRQSLNDLGNGGYPSQGNIKNIALISGSMTGASNTNYDGLALNQGDKLLDLDFVGIWCNFFVDVWSHKVNESFKTYDGDAVGLCSISFQDTYANLPINLDSSPGGFIKSGINSGFPIYNSVNPSFSFVPTYSAIDYKGPINNDVLHLNINGLINYSNQVTSPNLTPYHAIYGEDVNNYHAIPRDVINNGWNKIAYNEFGLTVNTLQPGCSLPVPSSFLETYTEFKVGRKYKPMRETFCKLPKKYKIDYTNYYVAFTIPDENLLLYDQQVYIYGNQTFMNVQKGGYGFYTFSYKDLPLGTYTLVVNRSFHGIAAGSSSYSKTFKVESCNETLTSNSNYSTSCPVDGNEGDVIGVLQDNNQVCFVNRYNNIWIATQADGTFVPRCRLIANGLSNVGATCFAEYDPSGATTPECGSISRRYKTTFTQNINALKNVTTWSGDDKITKGLKSIGWDGSSSPGADENFGDQYGESLNGFITPMITGNYTFWISSDDQSELWLSSNDDPINKQLRASVNGWTPKNNWTYEAGQKSIEVYLKAGTRYYFEVWHVESGGGDHVEVAWSMNPNDTNPQIVPSSVLLPYDNTTTSCDFNVTATSNPSNVSCGQAATLIADCQGVGCGGVAYTWTNGTLNYGGSVAYPNLPSTNNSTTFTLTASKANCANKNSSTVITVTGCGSSCNVTQPVSIGTWNGFNIELHQMGPYRVLVSVQAENGVTKYFPRGKDFWSYVSRNPNTDSWYNCINVSNSDWYNMSVPTEINFIPAGYYIGYQPDGARYFTKGDPNDPCNLGSPKIIGVMDGLNVELRQFEGLKLLVTVQIENGITKYFPRGKNFWTYGGWTRYPNTDVYYNCINVSESGWYGLSSPNEMYILPFGYSEGFQPDGARYLYANSASNSAREVKNDILVTSPDIQLTCYPNPTSGTSKVGFTLNSDEKVWLGLYDNQGRALKIWSVDGIKGLNLIDVNLKDHSSGNYFINLNTEKFKGTIKVIKVSE
ncbi:T9SS type A sorting domain-containing protein [Flectobacillus roseus]